jgi:hypothetical protein
MKKFAVQFIIAVILITGCNSPSSKNKALSHDQKMQGAYRTEKEGWIFIHIEGSPEKAGYQHGFLLADEIFDLRNTMAVMVEKSSGKPWRFYRDESFRLFWNKMPAEYQEEIDGIVSGASEKLGAGKIDRKDILAINAEMELPDYYVPWLNSIKDPKPEGHCSAIAATGSWTKDGKIVIAHNSWTSYAVGERWNIIIDIVPEKGNRIIMDALPGLIDSGDDYYINSAGLIVTETTITQFFGFDTSGVAEFVRARQAIQYSSSVDEWTETMLKGNNGGYANDWLLGDNKTGEIARFELGLKNHSLERTKDGCFVGANYPVGRKLTVEETTFDTTNMNSSPNARKLRWEMLMKEYKGKIDVEAAKKFMGDHYDAYNKTEKASSLTLCGHIDTDPAGVPCWNNPPYSPGGAIQGKATDGTLAGEMKLWAIMGHPCGEPFIAKDFLTAHPEFAYQKNFLRDMPSRKWTVFSRDFKE